MTVIITGRNSRVTTVNQIPYVILGKISLCFPSVTMAAA